MSLYASKTKGSASFLAKAWSSVQLAAPEMAHLSVSGQEKLQGEAEKDLGSRNPEWTQQAFCLVLTHRIKLWPERCLGRVASPSWAGNSVQLYLHTFPPSLDARQRGDQRGLPLEERAVLCRVDLQGVPPRKRPRAQHWWVFKDFFAWT